MVRSPLTSEEVEFLLQCADARDRLTNKALGRKLGMSEHSIADAIRRARRARAKANDIKALSAKQGDHRESQEKQAAAVAEVHQHVQPEEGPPNPPSG